MTAANASGEPTYRLPADWQTMSYAEREEWAFSGAPLLAEQRWRQQQFAAFERSAEGVEQKAEQVKADGIADGAPFKILTRSDLRRMPRVGWLIDGLVQTSGLVVLAGDGGIGKSAIAIDWAATIASGLSSWHGKRVNGPASVLYVAGEGVEGFEDRLQAWETLTGVAIPEDRLQFVSEGFSLTSERAAVHMELAVREHDYALVVLDTLSQLSSIENENDNAELSRVLNAARTIRQARPGTTVLIVHHVSKGGRVRGASTIRNNADAVIVARADPGANVSTFNLSTEHEHDGKQKNGRAETLDGFWLDSLGAGVVVRRGGGSVIEAAILALAADGLEHSSAEFAVAAVAATDAEKKAVRRTLAELVARGTLTENGLATTAKRWRLGQAARP